MVSNRTLVKIAVYGGFITVSTGMFLQMSLRERVRQSEAYRVGMKLIREHKAASILLGQPIKDSGFDMTDSENNQINSETARFKVPVRGPNQKGTYYFWSEKSNTKEEWFVKRAELELKNEPDKRLLIKRVTDS